MAMMTVTGTYRDGKVELAEQPVGLDGTVEVLVTFLAEAKAVGVDGLIVVDCPPEEDDEVCLPARRAGLAFIRLVAPTTDEIRLPVILGKAAGFVYFVSITGVTGSAAPNAKLVGEAVTRLKRHTKLPVVVGFGVKNADGAAVSFDAADVIMASAGATHPLQSWLDALKPEGRLLFPMTSARRGPGAMLLITRRREGQYTARFLCWVGFIDFQGARQENMSRRLAAALKRDRGSPVKSLRRDVHTRDDACWLHGKGWCLSRLSIGEAA